MTRTTRISDLRVGDLVADPLPLSRGRVIGYAFQSVVRIGSGTILRFSGGKSAWYPSSAKTVEVVR